MISRSFVAVYKKGFCPPTEFVELELQLQPKSGVSLTEQNSCGLKLGTIDHKEKMNLA